MPSEHCDQTTANNGFYGRGEPDALRTIQEF
jgi:hypothetical protein